ncbi:MAG: GMC family oxidoreductase [Nitrospirae bacterium]|nr:GMC family oxidoreductase [Nitrospirota bacterium]
MTILHANAVEVETNDTAQKVSGVKAVCLNGGRFHVKAKLFVLATGAIEIPRLLLTSNRVCKAGLGNQHDLVGRFFMEHPHLWSGIFIPSGDRLFRSTGLYRVHTVKNVPIMGKLTLSESVLRSERLLNYAVSIHPRLCPDPADHAGASQGMPGMTEKILRHVKGVRKIEGFALNHMSEQAPNPDSRIMLSNETDALGQRRIKLDWRLTASDMRTIRRAQQIIDEELQLAGLGRLHVEMRDDSVPQHITGGWHHMGTTRMHSDPAKGVVDGQCRVHGIANLFIAGPSVFPTCGYANPVLTIVALAARLGDHLKKYMVSFGG